MDVNVAAAAACAIAGLGVGLTASIAFRWSEREQARGRNSGTGGKHYGRHQPLATGAEPPLPPGVDTVLSVLRSCAIVLGEADEVVKASSAAYAMGLVRGGAVAVDQMLALARATRRDGEIRQVELEVPRPGAARAAEPLAVSVRVAPLGSRLVLVLVEDQTDRRRVEAVRRDFVANVSHELKTPVGALSLLSEAVADASDDPEAVQRFAGRMQIEATRLASLVQEIIDLSRVQDDRLMVDPEPVAVDELIAEAIDRCRQQAAAKQILISAGGVAGLYLHGNRGQLAAALGNLVENAVNYSPPRTRVAIATRRISSAAALGEADGELIEISVTDQGIGISEKDRERVFERFYRVDPARSRQTGGTGLGLSIVKHVAASHGGTVSVWSVEGQGSTFTIRLPAGQAPAAGDDLDDVEDLDDLDDLDDLADLADEPDHLAVPAAGTAEPAEAPRTLTTDRSHGTARSLPTGERPLSDTTQLAPEA
ncbi:sensor histidine kinase [Streptomyces rubellomurinus]|uniref:sensor histidine kinase n=1 Tax=Streptomyces rubellomurinus (strain ATCC 31215) TaxID=359131 RepID=UPI000AB7B127|nr:ATP-binding protein [Streptomyces rubellomurinus]